MASTDTPEATSDAERTALRIANARLTLALDELCRAIRHEPGFSVRTCSGRTHAALGSAEALLATATAADER